MIAKPLLVVALALFCLLGVACSPVSSQEATRQSPPTGDVAPEGSSEATATTPSPGADTADTADEEASGADDLIPEPVQPETVEPELAAGADEPAVPTSPPATAATASPVTPLETDEPDATLVAQPAPTATPVTEVQPTTTPAPVFVAPAPDEPVPSDGIVIEGPEIDESESASISDQGALACASTERAIEFLDVGDTTRMAAALEEAAQFASQAVEAEITLAAPALAAAGSDEEAALAAIVSTLGACAVHGYQV